MRTIKSSAILLATTALAGCLGGCPGTVPTDALSALAITGTWHGMLDCTFTITREGQEPTTMTMQNEFTTTYDANGLPANLQVAALSGGTAEPIEVNRQGAHTSWTSTMTLNGQEYTTTWSATVREATYTSTSAHVVIDITMTVSSESLAQQSTGTQTYDTVVSGDTMTYTSLAAYDITQTFTFGGTEQTSTYTQQINCTATLQRQ
ncbi:MAG: hypothetical protein KKB50_19570 [Planctomycetes bacterium]|nr:hypothetical protein [Planctomycetota bacterium]